MCFLACCCRVLQNEVCLRWPSDFAFNFLRLHWHWCKTGLYTVYNEKTKIGDLESPSYAKYEFTLHTMYNWLPRHPSPAAPCCITQTQTHGRAAHVFTRVDARQACTTYKRGKLGASCTTLLSTNITVNINQHLRHHICATTINLLNSSIVQYLAECHWPCSKPSLLSFVWPVVPWTSERQTQPNLEVGCTSWTLALSTHQHWWLHQWLPIQAYQLHACLLLCELE